MDNSKISKMDSPIQLEHGQQKLSMVWQNMDNPIHFYASNMDSLIQFETSIMDSSNVYQFMK